AGHADAEDRVLGPLVGAIQPPSLLAADDVEVDEPAERRVALGIDAGARGGPDATRREDWRVPLEDAPAEADLLVQRPAADLHARVAEGGETVGLEAERIGLQVGGDEV